MSTALQQAVSPPPPSGPAASNATKRCFGLGVNVEGRPPPWRETRRSRLHSRKAFCQTERAYWAAAPALTDHRYGHVVSQPIDQHGEASQHTRVVLAVACCHRVCKALTVALLACILCSRMYAPLELCGQGPARDISICS